MPMTKFQLAVVGLAAVFIAVVAVVGMRGTSKPSDPCDRYKGQEMPQVVAKSMCEVDRR